MPNSNLFQAKCIDVDNSGYRPPLDEEEDQEADEVIMQESHDQSPDQTQTAEDEEKEVANLMNDQVYITPTDARRHLRGVWDNDKKLMQCIFGALNVRRKDGTPYPSDVFFLEVVPVPPSRFRPVCGSYSDDKPFTMTHHSP